MKTSILSIAFLLSPFMVAPEVALADLPPGTVDQPVIIDAFPFAHAGNTSGKPRIINKYDCAPELIEGGGEVLYRFSLPARGRLFVYLQGDALGVDVDIHLLSRISITGGTAAGCLTRSNAYFEKDLEPGEYFLVVDSYTSSGTHLEGPYVLRVDFGPLNEWRERQIAQGVIWRQKVYTELFGGAQTANALVIDLARPDVSVKPVAASGCERTSSMGKRTGAVAGINGGFFSSNCASVSLLKIDGRLLATNAVTRTSLGLDANGQPTIGPVAAGQNWPQMTHALGGGPNLVSESGGQGTINVTDEGFPWLNQRHPRTALAVTGGGKLLMVTLDGRTEHGLGVDLYQLAQYLIWMGAVTGMNLDGGGSTTMYVAGASPSGVVNYPSDAAGERGVGSGLFVYAPRYNHPPRFLTKPPLGARAGEDWTYDADALDLDVEDRLVFSLEQAPPGMTVHQDSGVCRWRPQTGGIFTVRLAVSDGENAARQEFSIAVEGPDGGTVEEDAGYDSGDDADDDGDTDAGVDSGADNEELDHAGPDNAIEPDDGATARGEDEAAASEPLPGGDPAESGQDNTTRGSCSCGSTADPGAAFMFFLPAILSIARRRKNLPRP